MGTERVNSRIALYSDDTEFHDQERKAVVRARRGGRAKILLWGIQGAQIAAFPREFAVGPFQFRVYEGEMAKHDELPGKAGWYLPAGNLNEIPYDGDERGPLLRLELEVRHGLSDFLDPVNSMPWGFRSVKAAPVLGSGQNVNLLVEAVPHLVSGHKTWR